MWRVIIVWITIWDNITILHIGNELAILYVQAIELQFYQLLTVHLNTEMQLLREVHSQNGMLHPQAVLTEVAPLGKWDNVVSQHFEGLSRW